MSQRKLAKLSHLSFRTIQLLESDKDHDARISSLQAIAEVFHFPKGFLQSRLSENLKASPFSVTLTIERIMQDGFLSWKIHLFDFVDQFRKNQDPHLISTPFDPKTDTQLQALLAATVETLCDESKISLPHWTFGIAALKTPWFVAEIENLKTLALIESPLHFKKRNIFVLGNFLSRL